MMSFYISYDSVKKAGLLIFLLAHAVVLQAETSDIATAKTEATADSGNEDQQGKYNFPRWPERQQVIKEIIPPPPPGPYMSSALNELPMNRSSFDRDLSEPVIGSDSFKPPMQAFSPDMPWPDEHQQHPHQHNLGPTKRWMPEQGYRYVNPQVKQQVYPVRQNNPPSNYNYGYRRMPNMNWSGSRWVPSVEGGSQGPYPYAPGYAPGYSNPANNYGAQ